MKNRLVSVLVILSLALHALSCACAAAFCAENAAFASRLNFDIADSTVVRAIVVYSAEPYAAVESGLAAEISEACGAEVLWDYSAIFTGVAVDASYGSLKEIEKLDGVEAVYLANSYETPTYSLSADGAKASAQSLLGAEDAWSMGYTGQGTVIAVIDTGISVTHEAFNYTDSLQSVMDASDIKKHSGKLNGIGKYINEKIPFAYDYADGDTDITSNLSHGTSVAGVAAGNNGSDFKGIACDAQILGMKIFSDSDGKTDTALLFAAMEDAVSLGADVINLSLGSVNGFVVDSALESELRYSAVMENIEKAGIFLCCACGNEYSQGYKGYTHNRYSEKHGVDAVTAGYADYGTVNSPSTYEAAISVASVGVDGVLSDFSSRGTTGELYLKPEITGVGGAVYCPTGGVDKYTRSSGTSFACPTVSGLFAVMLSRYRSYGMSERELYKQVYGTVLSTAKTLYVGGVSASPRRQGAGLGDLSAALDSAVFFEAPIINMGDDPTFDGVYELSAALKLCLDEEVSVKFEKAELVCDTWAYDEELGGYYNLLTPHTLSASVSSDREVYTVTEDGAEAALCIVISEADKSYLSAFENGGFVEGYIYFSVYDGEREYSAVKLTVAGFYGDWGIAPAIESYDWGDAVNAQYYIDTVLNGSGTVYDVLDTDLGYTEAYITSGVAPIGFIGDNLYGSVRYNYDRMAFSTASNTGECLADGILFYPVLLRNVRNIKMTVSDADTGEVYYVDDTEYVSKNYYSTSTHDFECGSYFAFDGTSDGGKSYLPNGTRLKISFETRLAYQNAEFREERVYYVYIDNSAPCVSYTWDADTKLLTVAAKDNRYIAYVAVYDSDGETLLAGKAADDVTPGEYAYYTFDLSEAIPEGSDGLILKVCDYATNCRTLDFDAYTSGSGGDGATALLGDVNGDGKVNSLDAAVILRYEVGLTELDEWELAMADVNGDGLTDTLDAAAILKFDAGLLGGGFGGVSE